MNNGTDPPDIVLAQETWLSPGTWIKELNGITVIPPKSQPSPQGKRRGLAVSILPEEQIHENRMDPNWSETHPTWMHSQQHNPHNGDLVILPY